MAATGLYGTATLLLSLPAALADPAFFNRTCYLTTNPGACRSVLGHYFWSLNATTLPQLTGTGLDVAVFKARDITGAMSELSREGRYASTRQGDALAQCARLYDKAMSYDLDQGDRRLRAGKYGDALRFVSHARSAADACEKAFADRGVRSVVSDLNQTMKVYCGVVVDLIELLINNARSSK
jgi:pectinesterase inhibitor-like protein